MKREFVLGKISALMDWSGEKAQGEFAWLRLMSRMKYDDYQDFLAGMRFIESLAAWLLQFEKEHRECAYDFIKRRLVFFSVREMRHLVELFYHDAVQPRLMREAATRCGVPRYEVWSHQAATEEYQRLLRKSIFVELSDGARADVFRRANEGVISHEQVITAPRIHADKWEDMLRELQKDLGDENERFSFVFLLDDFCGSGTTLLRKEDTGEWKGKLPRFWSDISPLLEQHFAPDWVLSVHHYVVTSQAKSVVIARNNEKASETGPENWFQRVEFTWGTVLPSEFRVSPADELQFAAIVEQYYDKSIETPHIKKGGKDARWGFGECGLPLILEHNTPNNSIALLWAETSGDEDTHAMRPLFRRRQRHV